MSKVMAVRLPDEVAARVEETAAARGVKPAAWLKQVVEAALGDGAADRSREGAPRPRVRQGGTMPGEVSPVSEEEHAARMRERDGILARARASVVRRGR